MISIINNFINFIPSSGGQGSLPFCDSTQLQITPLDLFRGRVINLFSMKKFHFIYKTTNLINGKIYVGLHTTDDLGDGYLGSGNNIQRAIKKYGKENFKQDILEFCLPCIYHLNNRERFYINKENSMSPLGYNLTSGGEFLNGFSLSEETKRKMSEVRMGFNKGENHYLYGKNIPLHTRLKMSDSHKGENGYWFNREIPETMRIKIRNTLTGYKHTEEAKNNMGKSQLDKVVSFETRCKLRKINLGNKNKEGYVTPKEVKHKISESHKGKNHSEETLLKLKFSANNREKVKCEYCGKIGDISLMKRYHFDNCKHKTIRL